MSVLFIVVPSRSSSQGFGVAACIWAIRQGQYDDADTPAAESFSKTATPSLMQARLTQAPPTGTPISPAPNTTPNTSPNTPPEPPRATDA